MVYWGQMVRENRQLLNDVCVNEANRWASTRSWNGFKNEFKQSQAAPWLYGTKVLAVR